MLSSDLMCELKSIYNSHVNEKVTIDNIKSLQKECNNILAKINFRCVITVVPYIDMDDSTVQLLLFNVDGNFIDNIFLVS